MKRYSFYGAQQTSYETPHGEWVRAEDAEAELRRVSELGMRAADAGEAHTNNFATALEMIAKLRAVVEALPRCEHMSCQQGRPVATRIVWWDEGVEYYCDDCDCGRELPYADALRSLAGP